MHTQQSDLEGATAEAGFFDARPGAGIRGQMPGF